MTPDADAVANVLGAFPSVSIDLDNLSWYEGLLAGELRLAMCEECGELHHPHGPICPQCHSGDVTFAVVSGLGSVDLFTVVHVGPDVDGVDYTAGHAIVSVRLDGAPDVRITATMVGCEAHEIRRGLRVDSEVRLRGGVPTLVFRPALPEES